MSVKMNPSLPSPSMVPPVEAYVPVQPVTNDVQNFQEEKEKPAKHWTEDRVMNTFVEQSLAGLRRNAEEKLKHFRKELEEEESFGRR